MQGSNSEQSSTNHHQTIRISSFCEQYPSCFLLDSGATHNFISMDFIEKYGLNARLQPDMGSITFGNASTETSAFYADLPIFLRSTYTKRILHILVSQAQSIISFWASHGTMTKLHILIGVHIK